MKKSPRKRSIIVMSLILVILIPVLIFSVEMSKKMNLMRERNLDQKIIRIGLIFLDLRLSILQVKLKKFLNK